MGLFIADDSNGMLMLERRKPNLTRDQAEDLGTEDRRLCFACVGEAFLRAEIENGGHDGGCFYCGRQAKTFSIGEMADAIETAFEEHFYRTPTEPSAMEYAMIKEGDYVWERKGDPVAEVISSSAEIDEDAAEDVRKVLAERHFDMELAQMGDENPFGGDAHYAERGVDDAESQAGWRRFEQTLKTQARYFSRTAEATLTSIFEGMGEHKTRDGRPIIVEAGPGMQLAALYRARVFQSNEKLEEALKRPDKEVGPPPPLAAANGRMNAHGVAVFYGASDPVVALAEVRPPVGSNVVVARFELIRPVRLLDVEALQSVNVTGSIFDRDYMQRLERAKFLKWLSRRITMPVMPDDEPLDYLATQAIADFLATDANPSLDGILYPSVQGSEGKLNVVLFHKAARVQALDIPKGAEISADLYVETEDGLEIDYSVWEEVPPELPSATSNRDPLDAREPEDYNGRVPTLRLDISSLKVHRVNRIMFHTESHTVRRHRFEKRGAEF